MSILLTLISPFPYVGFPTSVIGWIGWLLYAAVLAFLVWKWRAANRPLKQQQKVILLILAILTIPTSLFFGLRFGPAGGALPPPEMPVDLRGPVALVFSALPWVFAAGLLGPTYGVGLALFSGLLQALYETHHFFTPLETGLMAVLIGAMLNQPYRTRVFRLLRQPLIASGLAAILYPLLYVTTIAFTARGVLAARLDFALAHIGGAFQAFGIELLVAGVFAQTVAMSLPGLWRGQTTLFPSPSERSLGMRFLGSLAPIALALVSLLMVADGMIAWGAARQMLRDRMATTAQMAADGVPYFLETGQNLIEQMAKNPVLLETAPQDLNTVLAAEMRTVPFFRQLFLLDVHGQPVAGYPLQNYNATRPPAEEQMGIQLALNGVPAQFYSAPPPEGEIAAQISFIATIQDEKEQVRGVLIGRSDLASNPFTLPILNGLNNLTGEDGQGMLLDENGQILYHPDPQLLMSKYTGRVANDVDFFDDTGPDGTRRLVYYQRASGRPWAVVLMVPAHRAQQLALRIAAPLLAVILTLTLLAGLSLRFGLRKVTGSLQSLSLEAERISAGHLDHPLPVSGEDEVGTMRRAFEGMRVSLKARLDELNRLLIVSQGTAASLDIQDAVKPVLEAAVATGACVARIVLAPDVLPDLEDNCSAPLSFGYGPARDVYSFLDEQVLVLTRQQDRLALTNLSRPRLFQFAPNAPRPASLLAIALRHENMYYGALWVAYDQPHVFEESEVRFLTTIASQAALAAANTRLFLNAETGRQRLAAILASNPDPVLVTDQHNRLLLANPAAWQVLSLGMEADEGQPIERVISQKEILGLLRSSGSEKNSIEVTLPGGRIFLATATPVLAEGRKVGRVCVLRDVTHFKELDALKTEFVNNVSHDLRSPLTLMRGNVKLLEMQGVMNEHQQAYVKKILASIDTMNRLVLRLLELGRVDAGVGLEFKQVPVQEMVEAAIREVQPTAAQKNVQLSIEMPPGPSPVIEVDASLLQQALLNLLDNAIKYNKPDGKVVVRVKQEEHNVLFEVSDTGVGVSSMDLHRLFEKFYRGIQQSATTERGVGLGLAIVKSFAERHGGSVGVESQLGKGSTFRMSIPVHQPVQGS